ncbi:MAG: HAD-IIIC family phosphatase [Bryobacterales bacterium]|nr:HAD-IIIC family phosphatase [Bryobacterales bacterium]
MSSPPFQFCIGATFTADPLQSVLGFWAHQLDAAFEVRFAAYNQVHQALLDPGSLFARNRHGVNVALVRAEDLGQFPEWAPEAIEALDSNLASLLNAVREAPARFGVPLIFCLCPPSDRAVSGPLQDWLAGLPGVVAQCLDAVPGVHLLDAQDLACRYPVARQNDPDAERLGRIPYTEEFFCALGTGIVRLADALYRPPYKVLVFDCDNTLWDGVCGEDGPEGVIVSDDRRALQEFALAQREDGALLAMASKNNEQDVLDTFAAHPEMPLRLEHFAAWRINWESKAQNLAELAGELSLGLDSFVFLDDNPRECAEVEDALPEVLCLTLPEPPLLPRFLRHVWAFDRPVVTEEDRLRNAYYSQVQEFGRELKKAESFAQFLAGLQLEVVLQPPDDASLPRVAQLTHRTNQFNFTTIRRTGSEIQALLADPRYRCLAARVTDRFGDYGIVGVVITVDAGEEVEVDTFLLSCRVLGRGVEHRILAEVARDAQSRGRRAVRLRWEATAKNRPARQFLESATGRALASNGTATLTIPVEELASLRYEPEIAPPPPPEEKRPAKPGARKFVDFARIARELLAPGAILAAMRAAQGVAAPAAGMSDTEARLAAIWCDVLKVPGVSPRDNFFDAGGHSLLAVLLILRVKEAFGVELPVEDVYSASATLADLALRIESYRLRQTHPDEYAGLLAEIEEMSDEEVRRLLEAEG